MIKQRYLVHDGFAPLVLARVLGPPSSMFGDQGSESRVTGSGFRVLGFGFGVWG